MRIAELHRKITAAMALAALAGFVSGAGIASPAPVLAGFALLLAFFWQPSRLLSARLEPVLRVVALGLALRAFYHIVAIPQDVVLPMVDLLLLLLSAEVLRRRDANGDARLHSLSFALLVASAAYRPGVGFAVAFLAYIALTTLALLIGHLRRQTERRRLRNVSLRPGFLLRTAALSAIVLAVSGAVFVAFPRVSRGWVSRGMSTPRTVVGFGDQVSLGEHGARIESNPEVVLRVEFPRGAPADPERLYWRGRSYDAFDGVRWRRSNPYGVMPSRAERSWPGPELTQLIYAVPLETPVLFGVHPIMNIRSRSRIRPIRDGHGDYMYLGLAEPVYSVTSRAGPPPPGVLRNAPRESPPGGDFYLQLPRLNDRIAALADSLTADATTDYDRVRAIETWLRTRFSYTLELPRTAREATLENFLFERRAGHCEYFSTALAVLLRTQGIATRNVNGFLGGEWNEFGNYLTVTQNQAHSWVEVWFAGVGWVPFDATPAALGGETFAARNTLGPFRFLFDGFEHRWNKWVLDYDLDRQFELVREATEAFSTPARAMTPDADATDWRRVALAAAVAIAMLMLWRVAGSRTGRTLPPASLTYLRLRKAYERAGVTNANLAPLAFGEALHAAAAPGAGAAERVVALYVQNRFGGARFDDVIGRRMRKDAAEALSALRREKRRRFVSRLRADRASAGAVGDPPPVVSGASAAPGSPAPPRRSSPPSS